MRLGDWFRVIQLAHGANEDVALPLVQPLKPTESFGQELLHQAWSAIGDYYADRCKSLEEKEEISLGKHWVSLCQLDGLRWPNAANYYAKAG